MPPFRSLKKPLLSQEVEKQLKLSILEGRYAVGEKLPSERELVEQFQVSRVTVREALRSLQRSGLAQIKRGIKAGAYVCEPNSEIITESFQNLVLLGKVNFSHLIDARLYIEPRTAAFVAKIRKTEDVERIQNLIDRAYALLKTSRYEARLVNVSFHCEIAKITKNPIIIFITESITQSYSEAIIKKTQKRVDKDRVAELIEEHRSILKAITDKDPVKAYDRTKQHLLDTYEMYSKVSERESGDDIDAWIRQGHGGSGF